MENLNNKTIGIKEVVDFFLILYAIILVSFTTHLSHVAIVKYISFILLSVVYIFTYGFKLDKIIIYIILVWFIVNIFSSYFNGTAFNFNAVVGYLIGIGIPCLIIIIIGKKFWVKFEKVLFVFTVISTFIYILNLIFPTFFWGLSYIFQPITADIFKERYPLYWTSIIYTHSYDANAPVEVVDIRNSGFMWEPGGLAMLITILILYNWYTNGFVVSKKVFFYVLVLVITFSTAGYLSLAVLLLIYILKNKNYRLLFISLVLFIAIFPSIFNIDFLGPKIEKYLIEQDIAGYKQSAGIYEVNRFAAFIIKAHQFSLYPFGYGIVADEKVKGIIDGVNGIGDILFRWGIIGIVFLIIALNKFFKYINKNYLVPRIVNYLSILAILIVFFSNPIELHPLLFFIVLTPYIFKNSTQFDKK